MSTANWLSERRLVSIQVALAILREARTEDDKAAGDRGLQLFLLREAIAQAAGTLSRGEAAT